MCAIIGAILKPNANEEDVEFANRLLDYIWQESHQRGRDGRGFSINSTAHSHPDTQKELTVFKVGDKVIRPVLPNTTAATVIGNLRAEPTTEYVKDKRPADQQPYTAGSWTIVHNGTIANDKELRTGTVDTTIDSAAIAEHLDAVAGNTFAGFVEGIGALKGSYAILASHIDDVRHLFVAANYRPVWYIVTQSGAFFASARDYFPPGFAPQMLPPYKAAMFDYMGLSRTQQLYKQPTSGRALVVCSGGLDSVVSATYAQRNMGKEIHLIHFLYGSRAEGPEVEAVKRVAEYLGCELTLFPLNVYSKDDSPLLDPDSPVAGGEAGAEFAHEWVPARNLLLLSVATAFAEARGIDTIVLGNNLEEAGAYPDNEPEFIARFNDLLPFAVGDGKRMRVVMPVGNMMKHEIVALGHKWGAPMGLTWSCYRAGELHCGTCGPCYMRRKAFEINGLPEVIGYEDNK